MNDKEMQQIIKNLEEKVKRLEKSNRNWRRKCQRLRNEKNKVQWFSEMIKPEEHKRVIVRDKNGKEYRNHEWIGHAWYSFSGCDGCITDVEVISWRYQQNQSFIKKSGVEMGYTIFGKVDTLEEFEKLKSKKEPEFTIKEEPFSWNDNFSEVALEDFSIVQKKLPYGICQSIGMALAKLELLEKQGNKVEE